VLLRSSLRDGLDCIGLRWRLGRCLFPSLWMWKDGDDDRQLRFGGWRRGR
jgi:hypothetical protein